MTEQRTEHTAEERAQLTRMLQELNEMASDIEADIREAERLGAEIGELGGDIPEAPGASSRDLLARVYATRATVTEMLAEGQA